MDKCEACPRLGSDLPCVFADTDNIHACRRVKEGRAGFIALVHAGGRGGISPVRDTDSPATNYQVVFDWITLGIDLCPARQGCQCNGAWPCSREDRPDNVSRVDCARCLS